MLNLHFNNNDEMKKYIYLKKICTLPDANPFRNAAIHWTTEVTAFKRCFLIK